MAALGRPTKYTEDLADEICALVSTGMSLNKICGQDDDESKKHIPCRATVYKWFRLYPEFVDNYARAKAESGDADQDKLDEIAEKVLSGELEPQAARVAADIIKWSASKKKPKKYGDRIETVHSGSLSLTDLSEDELDRRLAETEQADEQAGQD